MHQTRRRRPSLLESEPAVHGDVLEAPGLGEVVVYERVELAQLLEAFFDQVAASGLSVGGAVGDAHDPVDALADEDAFADVATVLRELHGLSDLGLTVGGHVGLLVWVLDMASGRRPGGWAGIRAAGEGP